MTAGEGGSLGAVAVITVRISIRDAALADRVRRMLLDEPDIRIADQGNVRPSLSITDGAVDPSAAAPVLVLGSGPDVLDAVRAGAAAVLPAGANPAAIGAAVRAVAQGLIVFTPEARAQLIASADPDGLGEADDRFPAIELTEREVQVLALLAGGASNKVIARSLGITPHTAKFHVASIVAKLGATGRTDAVARAMRTGLLMF